KQQEPQGRERSQEGCSTSCRQPRPECDGPRRRNTRAAGCPSIPSRVSLKAKPKEGPGRCPPPADRGPRPVASSSALTIPGSPGARGALSGKRQPADQEPQQGSI